MSVFNSPPSDSERYEGDDRVGALLGSTPSALCPNIGTSINPPPDDTSITLACETASPRPGSIKSPLHPRAPVDDFFFGPDVPDDMSIISSFGRLSPNHNSPESQEPPSVDDFLFELDAGIEPSLDPPPSDDTSSVSAPPRLRRLSSRFLEQEPVSSDASSIASSVTPPSTRSSVGRTDTSSLASANAFCYEYLESRPYKIYSLRTFCESLFKSSCRTQAKILSVTRYITRTTGLPHTFLVFHVVRADGKDLHLRVDRKPDPNVPLGDFMMGLGISNAMDTVAISWQREYLYDSSRVEALMLFPTAAPLVAIAQILYDVASESHQYIFTQGGCLFFTSVIQELLILKFGAQYSVGVLDRPTLAIEARTRVTGPVYQALYHAMCRDIDSASKILLKYTALIGEPNLASAVKFLLENVQDQQRPAPHSTSYPMYVTWPLHPVKKLLAMMVGMFHEHLYGCSGAPGARILSNDFPIQFLEILQPWGKASLRRAPLEKNFANLVTAVIGLLSETTMAYPDYTPYHRFEYEPINIDLSLAAPSPKQAHQLVMFVLNVLRHCVAVEAMPSVWGSQMNCDIPDLRIKFEELVSTTLGFARRQWIVLLCETDCRDSEVMATLSGCLPVLLHWIAAMGIMGEVDKVCLGLRELDRWMDIDSQATNIKHTICDLYRLVLQSKRVLETSSLSILDGRHAFIPSDSPLRAAYPGIGASLCRIVADDMNTIESWPLQVLKTQDSNKTLFIAFLQGGRHITSVSNDLAVHVWDVPTGATIRGVICKGRSRQATSFALSSDGCRLAAAEPDFTIRTWDTETGEQVSEMIGHTALVGSIMFSQDSRYIASASTDGAVCVWDSATGSRISDMRKHVGLARCVALSVDGHYLASAADDATLFVWDAARGIHLRELKGHTRLVASIAFSPDGNRLASASHDFTIRMWDAATGAVLHIMEGHTDWVRCVVYSIDGGVLASASDDCTIQLWNPATGEHVRQLRGHNDLIRSIAFSPDGRYLASASHDQTTRVWDMTASMPRRQLEGHHDSIHSIVFSPDGCSLASASSDRTVRIWNVSSGASIRELKGHTDPVTSVAFSPDGLHLASASHDRTIRTWDLATGAPLLELGGHFDWVRCVTYSSDGSRLASSSDDCTILVWDAATGECLQELTGHARWVSSIVFSPDGHDLVSASGDNTLRCWDISSNDCIQQQTFKMPDTCQLSFSTDGSMLHIQDLARTTYMTYPGLVHASSPAPGPHSIPFTLHLDQNSLCMKQRDVTHHICWLPDYFEPSTPIAQYGDHVCIGGTWGMIAFIDLKGLLPSSL